MRKKICNTGFIVVKAVSHGKGCYRGYIYCNGQKVGRESSNKTSVNNWLSACVILVNQHVMSGMTLTEAFNKATKDLKGNKELYKTINFHYLFTDNICINGQYSLNFKDGKEKAWMTRCRELRTLKTGYTYVMYNNETGFYKIGKSNNIYERWQHLCMPHIDVVLYLEQNIEKILHRHYACKRRNENNEWFLLDDSDINELRKTFGFKMM